jgi:hypothetical protein
MQKEAAPDCDSLFLNKSMRFYFQYRALIIIRFDYSDVRPLQLVPIAREQGKISVRILQKEELPQLPA